MSSAGDWLSSIFTGKNKTLDSNINQFGQDAGVATTLGTGDATAASKEYQDILSGDPTKEAAAIAPETKAAQDQAAQAKKTTAEFGTRGGGTGGALQGIDASTRANLISLLGGLKTTAAAGAASLGTAEQGLSLSDKEAQDAASQQRMKNEMDSILGKGTSQVAGAAFSDLASLIGGGAPAAAPTPTPAGVGANQTADVSDAELENLNTAGIV